MLQFEDEEDLFKKIVSILNKQGFNFEKTKNGESHDIVDKINKIYVEIKVDDFNPTQLLYDLVQNNYLDINYVAFANAYEARFYKLPLYRLLIDFVKKIDLNLSKTSSCIKKKVYTNEAFELLGSYICIFTYDGILDLEHPQKEVFINENNYIYFKMLFEKSSLNPAKFLPYIANVYLTNNQLKINSSGYIIEFNTG